MTTGEQPRLDQDEADTFTEQEPWLIAVHDKRSDVIGQRPSTLLGVLLALLSAVTGRGRKNVNIRRPR